MNNPVSKLIFSIFLAISSLSSCTNKSVEMPEPETIEATTENLTFNHTFEYGESGADWFGTVQNKSGKELKPFIIELYLLFKDGKELLATTIYVDGMQPDEIYKLDEDITEVYRENNYGTDDHKAFRILVKQIDE